MLTMVTQKEQIRKFFYEKKLTFFCVVNRCDPIFLRSERDVE